MEHGHRERPLTALPHVGPGQRQSTTQGPSPGKTVSPWYTDQHCMTVVAEQGPVTCPASLDSTRDL